MPPVLELPPDVARQDKGPTILAVCCTLTAVATLFVAARLYVRSKILARVGLDDWLIMLSMASSPSNIDLECFCTDIFTAMRLYRAWPHDSGCKVWQWTSFCNPDRRAKVWSHFVHAGRVLSWHSFLRYSEAGCGCPSRPNHQSQSKTQDFSVVHDNWLSVDPVWLRDHHFRTV
jgi:hypothetical protein